ncbi:hypothetical protein FRB93_003318 [Tulasnella sp. JGI-2019a]|nr:hypothetical protein FRB93_003318 [Tulasnella sp. JGI-2019a]
MSSSPLMVLFSDIGAFPFWLYDVSYTTLGIASVLAYLSYKACDMLVVRPYFSPLRSLRGPDKLDSYVFGHLPRIFKSSPGVPHEECAALYGPTFQYRGIGLSRMLFTMDPRAVAHIMNHSYDYPKPLLMRENLTHVLGEGVLVAEGDAHRRQRRIMNPCFGVAQIRDLMPIFWAKSFELRDIWLNVISESSGEAEIDVLRGLSRMTLDVIGLAGFNYNFNSLVDGETNELAKAFHNLSAPTSGLVQALKTLQARVPPLKLIPNSRRSTENRSREVMDRIGLQLVEEKKVALSQENGDVRELKSKNVEGRDLLSVLIKANMASDVKESARMTDHEMIGQITTMLLAGQDTTSTSVMWLLYELAKPNRKHIQERLRAEIVSSFLEESSMEELNALPYLDAVIRENLRINPVVESITRDAARDDIISLSTPIVDRNGVERREVRIGAGNSILLSIHAMNRDKTIWGEDAHEFNPERWFNPDSHPRSNEVPGVHSGIMTFIGGPRHCIGYRFALMEMKVLVFTLLRNMSYSLPTPTPEVKKRAGFITRPIVTVPDGTLKSYMPLIVKAVGEGQ